MEARYAIDFAADVAICIRLLPARRLQQFVTTRPASLRHRAEAPCTVAVHERSAAHPGRGRRPRHPHAAERLPAEERLSRDCGRRGQGDAAHARADAHRPHRAGPDAAGRGRPQAVPRPARPVADPGADAHGARRGDRPRARPGGRRRRLPAEALQSARAGRAHQGDPAPHGAHAARSGSAPGQRLQVRRLAARQHDAHALAQRRHADGAERCRVSAAFRAAVACDARARRVRS